MTIYEQMKELLKDQKNKIVTAGYITEELNRLYGTNPASIIPSDYCYNRYNKGIRFTKHLFQYINRNTYKYLGENYPFTGLIYHNSRKSKKEVVVGEWKNGERFLYRTDENLDDAENTESSISKEQIIRMYETYNDILRLEMNILQCQPTELRHLIGRIGEFLCAIQTNGSLAREVNQHGFDVISKGRRVSVKTTAQKEGFITINQNTFGKFDDLFVVQYMDDNFEVIYYGPKEEILSVKRDYGQNYEVDIKQLKRLGK